MTPATTTDQTQEAARRRAIDIVNIKFKAKWKNLTVELGREPTSKDSEFWMLGDWYKSEMGKYRTDDSRHQEGAARGEIIEVEVEHDDGTVETVQYMTAEDRKCEVCWEPLRKKIGRGRWPKRCEACKAGKTAAEEEAEEEGQTGGTP